MPPFSRCVTSHTAIRIDTFSTSAGDDGTGGYCYKEPYRHVPMPFVPLRETMERGVRKTYSCHCDHSTISPTSASVRRFLYMCEMVRRHISSGSDKACRFLAVNVISLHRFLRAKTTPFCTIPNRFQI